VKTCLCLCDRFANYIITTFNHLKINNLKNLFLIPILLLFLYSCSPDEETQAPTNTVEASTPEPETVVVQYTLTVTAGEGGSVTNGGTYDEGASVTVTANPNEGYEFIGWDGNDSTNQSLTITINSNQTIKANFIISQSSIEFNSNLTCNTPMYSDMPDPNSEENNYKYFSYLWQTEEGKSKICLNSYTGVPEEAITLINEALFDASNRLGQLLPINITAYYNGISDLDLVMNNWKALKMTPEGFDPSDFTAAAGVDFSNIHNGGQGEISQGIWEYSEGVSKKIIYHEYFHIHQNSHTFYFEDTNNFGWNENRITDKSTSDYIPLVGPVWLEEGGADFAAVTFYSENNLLDYNSFFTELLDQAREVITDAKTREDIVRLEDYNTGDNIRRFESSENPTGTSRKFAYQYSAGAIAHLYILKTGRATLDNMIIDYYKNLAELEREHYGEGYKYSFESSFGISIQEFYLEFDEFMLKSRDEQLTILELN